MIAGFENVSFFTEDYGKSFVVEGIFALHFLNTEYMVNMPV